MIEKKGSGAKIDPNQNMTDIKSLELKSNTELLNAIDNMMAQPAEEIDMDFVDACLDILQKRAPVMEGYDPQAALNEFQGKHSYLLESEARPSSKVVQVPKHTKTTRKFRYAGAFVAAVLCFVVTANALGYNPVQTLFKWVNDTIQLFGDPSGLMELPPDTPGEYHSLDEALEANGLSSANRITWIPKDYALSSIHVNSHSQLLKVSAVFESERGELVIQVLSFNSEEWYGMVESDFEGAVYKHNSIDYYISSNYEFTIAGWLDRNYSYEISGQISEEEAKKMIDSIT